MVGSAVAEEADATRAAAETLLDLFNMDDTYDKTMEQAARMSLNIIDQQAVSEEEKKQAREAAEAAMKTTLEKFSWQRMKSMFVDIYAEVLSVEEINGLIAFYESPVGQAFLAKQPQLTEATMRRMQTVMQEVMQEVKEETQDGGKQTRPDEE
jgi:hypothetical protein